MNKRSVTFVLLLLVWLGVNMASAQYLPKLYQVFSPDKKLMMGIEWHNDGLLTYTFAADRDVLIKESPLGFKLESQETVPSSDWKIEKVRSGDPDNLEGRAAAYYWKYLFGHIEGFTRDREGIPPNNLLNYGYAILRAIVARGLVTSGMLPTLGIHHHNRYNAYCLADDIMELYRPYVDELVFGLIRTKGISPEILTREWKASLLSIPTLEVKIGGKRSPLMIAVAQTTASLYKCFSGEQRRIVYPER